MACLHPILPAGILAQHWLLLEVAALPACGWPVAQWLALDSFTGWLLWWQPRQPASQLEPCSTLALLAACVTVSQASWLR